MVAKAVVPYSGPDCPIVEPEAAELVLHAGLDLVLTFQQSLTLVPLNADESCFQTIGCASNYNWPLRGLCKAKPLLKCFSCPCNTALQ